MGWIASHAGLIGLLFFFAFFTGVILYVFRPGTKKQYESTAHIPLKEDQ